MSQKPKTETKTSIPTQPFKSPVPQNLPAGTVVSTPDEDTQKDWKHLVHLKSSTVLSLWTLFQRVTKTANELRDKDVKAQVNYLEKTAELIQELAEKLNEDCAPAPLKDISAAYDYALSRKYDGTYLALLDAGEHLVKTVTVVKNEVWSTMPEVSLVERETVVKMLGKYVIIDGTEFGKTDAHPEKAGQGVAVPKRVSKVVPFACKPVDKKVFKYEQSTDADNKKTEGQTIKRK